MVLNNTKVFRARLKTIYKTREIEVFLLKSDGKFIWEALLRPAKHIPVGTELELGGLTAKVIEKQPDSVIKLVFSESVDKVLQMTDLCGEVPIPPYVDQKAGGANNYQTVYAYKIGSVAVPMAGFHFTEELLDKIQKKSVEILKITLHVGLGIFRPAKTESLDDHIMHQE